jgi:hypothetical protein
MTNIGLIASCRYLQIHHMAVFLVEAKLGHNVGLSGINDQGYVIWRISKQ